MKIYKHYQQGFLTNEQLNSIYKNVLKDKMKKSFEIKINVDIKVYEYGVTYNEIYEFIEDLQFSNIKFNEYNTVMISNTLIDLFPYFDIYNNIIINVNLV